MKKSAFGCLLVLMVLAAGAAAAGYAFYRKVHSVRSTLDKFAELATVRDLDRSVRNQAAYRPPDSGELTRSQVQRYLRVQQAVRAHLGVRAAELERKYAYLERKAADLEKREKEGGRSAADIAGALALPDLVNAYGDLATAYMDGKRAQVDALNDGGFSLAEYRWVRGQMYAAVGMRDVDIFRIIDDVRSGRTLARPNPVLPTSPNRAKHNQELVAPYRKELESYVALAFLGL